MIIYYLIFYSITKLLQKLGNKDFPMYGSVGIVSGAEFFILMALENNGIFVFFKGNSAEIVVGIALLFYYLNYLILIKNANHEKYKNIIGHQSVIVKIIIFLVSFIIVCAPFYLFFSTL